MTSTKFGALGALFAMVAIAQQSLTLAHNDANQTGWNSSETVLTPAAVSGGTFGYLGSWQLGTYSFAQPLIVPHVTIGGHSHDVMFVADLNNNVFAYDADSPSSGALPLWQRSLGATWASGGGGAYYTANVGCIGTPTVDVANGWLFVLCAIGSTPNWTIFELNMLTGATVGSAVVAGSVSGTGDSTGSDCVSGGVLSFCPAHVLAKPGLLLANGNVYLSFGSVADTHPYHGWEIAYSEAGLSQVGIWCATPNGYGGAIWQSGAPPAADGSGNIYVLTGNGDGGGASANYADAAVKLSSTLALVDWFTPSNYAALESGDLDVSANRPLLIPGENKLVVAAKDFNVYIVDTGCMGHVQGSGGGCTLQTWKTDSTTTPSASSGSYSALWMNSVLFLPVTEGGYYSYSYSSPTFNTTPVATVAYGTYAFPNATISGSSNGASNAIFWTVTTASSALTSVVAGTLRAWNPATFAEYWNSGATLGSASKYSAPTVVNGNVYVTTSSNTVVKFGLIASSSGIAQSPASRPH